jgi:predicted nuclease of predicted toxin-antitoxin system
VRLLLDKNLSFRLVAVLEAGGHDLVHVDDLDLDQAADEVILDRARELDRVVVSSDTDFGALLAAQRADGPSMVLTREIEAYPASEIAELLLAALDVAADVLGDGAIVVVGREDVRVRRLPLR